MDLPIDFEIVEDGETAAVVLDCVFGDAGGGHLRLMSAARWRQPPMLRAAVVTEFGEAAVFAAELAAMAAAAESARDGEGREYQAKLYRDYKAAVR